jgi:DNA polymerase-3 subunit gamma/tau
VSTALYRRYRPESFADVIGQDHVTEPLMQALRTGRVSHAYLFSGPRGCGKTTSARILARCLNCEQGPAPVPCGVCDSCVALARDGSGSVDVIEIDAASHGGVDDARDLRERASYGPALSRYKIYIIDEAHMVTPQGFNALLKIVEEPPEFVKFIFATTQPDKVIATIRSRTHHYPFRLVPPLVLQEYLADLCASEGVAVAPGVLSFVVRAGGGSVRDSLSVLDQLMSGSGEAGLTYQGAAALLGFTEGELLDATIDGFAAGDAGAVFRQIDKVIETGQDPRRFVEDLLERFRDLIVVAAVPDGASSILRGTPEDQLERIRRQSAAFGPGALSRAADVVNAGLTEMTGATAPRLQLELICARVLLPGSSGENGYAARLDRLERRLEMSGATQPARREPGPGPASPTEVLRDPQPVPPTAEVVSATSPPDSEPVPGQGPLPEPVPGGIDTDAIRRSWPDILAKIFTIRRSTWTFLSANTQVLDYDGTRLLLGMKTEGLVDTLQRGHHRELVRQALSEVLGVDAVVEGIATVQSSPAPPAAASSASVAPKPGAPAAAAPARATSPDVRQAPAAPTRFDVGVEPPSTPMQRARAAIAREAGTLSGSASPSVADDSMVSADDEDIEQAGSVGQPVIARVLGGTVIGELDQ